MTDAATSDLTDWELQEIKRANDSGLTPIAFAHGLWLLSSSWQNWRGFFGEHGYATIAPGWPDDPATLEDAYKDPTRTRTSLPTKWSKESPTITSTPSLGWKANPPSSGIPSAA